MRQIPSDNICIKQRSKMKDLKLLKNAFLNSHSTVALPNNQLGNLHSSVSNQLKKILELIGESMTS